MSDYQCPRCGESLERFKAKSGRYWWRCKAAGDVCDELFADRNGEPKLTTTSREPAADWIKCPECQSPMEIVVGAQFGDFFSCSNYPKCKGIRDILPDSSPPVPPPDCPECGSRLKVKRGKKGLFLGCAAWPGCGYTRDLGGDD